MTYQIFIQALLPALMTAILGGITSAVTMFVMMRTKIFDHDQRLKRIEDRDIPEIKAGISAVNDEVGKVHRRVDGLYSGRQA